MRDRQPVQREWRFLQLTLFIVAWMLLAPHLRDRWITHLLLQLFLVNSVLVTLWANPGWRRIRASVIALWLVSLAGSLAALVPLPGDWQLFVRTAEVGSLVPLLALLCAGILTFAFRTQRLSVDGIFATIAVYLLIALLFAQLYLLTLAWTPAAFQLPTPAAERLPQLLQSDMLYYSVVTLATVGYGDVLPVCETARALAVIEAVVGQFYVAVVVAVFVGMFAAQRRD